MFKILPTVIGCLGLMATSVMADTALKTKEQQSGYTIGIQMGKQLMTSKDDLDLDAIKLGMKDVFSGAKPRLSPKQMEDAITAYQESRKKRELSLVKKFKEQSTVYLESNKKKKGVVTLPSGLQYKVLKSGEGKVSPKATDTVVTHYHGTLIDGTVFDSSYDRGETVSFPVNRVIPGWTEALQLMKAGDKWQLVIPSRLAYGNRGVPPQIKPGSTLVFDVELISIK